MESPQEYETSSEQFSQANLDAELIREADRLRRHEQEMARIESDRQIRLEKVKSDRQQDRRTVFVIVTLIVVLAGSVFGIAVSCNNTASDCVASGGVWDGGTQDCTR